MGHGVGERRCSQGIDSHAWQLQKIASDRGSYTKHSTASGCIESWKRSGTRSGAQCTVLAARGLARQPAEIGKEQALAAAEAIPILQYLVREGPPRFQEKAEILLQCLPGSLVVTVKQGHNLKQSVGSTNAFCKLTLGNGPPRQTKVRIPLVSNLKYIS